jgi:protein MPE1
MEKLSKGNFQSFIPPNGMMPASMSAPMNMPNAMAMPTMGQMGPMAMMGMPPNMMNQMMPGAPWAMPPMGPMNMNMGNNFPNSNAQNFNNGAYGAGQTNNSWQNQPNQQQWQNNNQQAGYSGQSGNFAGRGRGGNSRQNNFNKQHPNEEDSPYFRQPVNPHRHQKAKRMRPSEFTELGRN